MKKLTVISFLLIFLFANTEMGELLKLPLLFHHYLEHHDDDAGVSFNDFLIKHYAEKETHHSANNEHEKLPFKSHDFGFTQTILAYQSQIDFQFKRDKPTLIKKNIDYFTAFHTSSALTNIWQPPRSC